MIIVLKKNFIVLFFVVSSLLGVSAQAELLNVSETRRQLGLDIYPLYNDLSQVKIAVLDNGFTGFKADGKVLPRNSELIAGPKNDFMQTVHGLGMAQIVWELSGKQELGPKFYLINSNGFTNLKAAIDFVIQNKIQIVLYSQVWPFGSNFDGKGLIDNEVTRATQAGVIWVNAAGNHRNKVFSQKVLSAESRKDLRFVNTKDENTVTVTLSWSDFGDNENYSTNKDLDLQIVDSEGNVVGSSELIQRGEAPTEGAGSKLSSFPRESILLKNLDRGEYRIRIRRQSDNFTAQDRLKILLVAEKSESVNFKDRTPGEEILAPADHAEVLTVGDLSPISSLGPTADGRDKPEILLEAANADFSNGNQYGGSSTAAAFFAAVVVSMKAQWAHMTVQHIRNYLKKNIQFAIPPNYNTVSKSQMDAISRRFVPERAQVAQHPNGRWVVFTAEDPKDLSIFSGARERCSSLPTGYLMAYLPYASQWGCFYPEQDSQIQNPWIEFRKGSSNSSGFWRTPLPRSHWMNER